MIEKEVARKLPPTNKPRTGKNTPFHKRLHDELHSDLDIRVFRAAKACHPFERRYEGRASMDNFADIIL